MDELEFLDQTIHEWEEAARKVEERLALLRTLRAEVADPNSPLHRARVELLVNTTGKFDGSKAVKLPAGPYAFDLSADGAWSIRWR
jgi:hypothetical protein